MINKATLKKYHKVQLEKDNLTIKLKEFKKKMWPLKPRLKT